VILAGGKGSRLNAEERGLPKCLMPVGGKPVLLHQLDWCARWGLSHVRLYIAQMGNQVRHFVENNAPLWPKLNISFFEEPFPAGTAGGLALDPARPDEDFLLIYGDIIFNLNLERLYAFHRNKKADLTLVVHPNDHPYDSDLLDVDSDDRVVAVYPKPHDVSELPRRNLVNAAFYVLSPVVYPYIPAGVPSDFARDILSQLIQEIRVYGYNTLEYIKDMGTPDRLAAVSEDVQLGLPEQASYNNRRPAVFLDRDGVLNPEKGFLTRWQDYELLPGVAEAVKELNRRRWPVIVVTNQSGLARNLMTETDLRLIHNRLDQLLAEHGAWVDDLYYCPHHPDKGYPEENPTLKVVCSCRKPAPGMLLMAAERHHLHLSGSWMIGDARRDIEAGRAAGASVIGVRTGFACRDALWPPEVYCADLAEAVRFLTHDVYWQEVFTLCEKLKPYKGVLIAGPPSSGKSTLAGALKHLIKQTGRAVYLIPLDFWIAPADERPDGVKERLGLPQLLHDLQLLYEGKSVTLYPYLSHSRRRASETVTISLPDDSFVILEGVAGSLPDLTYWASAAGLAKVWCTVPPTKMEQRIRSFYAWKGLSPDETETILQQRLPEELAFLESQRETFSIVWACNY
jgi:histidinol-phosphate phosphatase family protein